MRNTQFSYTDERFADILMLRYKLDNFSSLSLRQKKLVYYLSEAALYGRDITFDQFGRYNLKIRKVFEQIYLNYKGDRTADEFKELVVYLKRVWFSSGIYHHYGCDKFVPGFSEAFFIDAVKSVDCSLLPLDEGQTVDGLCEELLPIIFDPDVMPVKVNKKDGFDLVETSACNFYDGVTQSEVEEYYASKKNPDDKEPLSYGLNTTVKKCDGRVVEEVWRIGAKYGAAIEKIVYWLEMASTVAENDKQRSVIDALIKYYKSGDLADLMNIALNGLMKKNLPLILLMGLLRFMTIRSE